MKFVAKAAALTFFSTAIQLHAALTVHTDFESGSAKVLELNSEAQTIRISPAGDAKRGLPIWWYLHLDGVDTSKPVTLEVAALNVPVPANGKGKPLNPNWTLPTRAVVSSDGINWQQTSPCKRQGNHGTYTVSANSSTLWLAWGPPFTPHDATTFVEKLGREHAFVKTFTLGKSLEGRVVPGLEIYEGGKPLTERPAVWINGRQHAWEVGGSWVAKSFAEWLAGDDEHAVWLRQNAQVIFVPLMDVDHVATGDGGKEALPQDQNRDWTDAPHWPEIAAAQKRILPIVKEGRMAVYIDVHNPSPGQKLPKFYVTYPPYIGEKGAALEDRFLAFARETLGEIDLVDEKPSKPENVPEWHTISTPWFIEHGNPQTIALTLEVPWNTPQGTVEGYRALGQKLGVTVAEFLRNNSAK
jgi:hypothetical protein